MDPDLPLMFSLGTLIRVEDTLDRVEDTLVRVEELRPLRETPWCRPRFIPEALVKPWRRLADREWRDQNPLRPNAKFMSRNNTQ